MKIIMRRGERSLLHRLVEEQSCNKRTLIKFIIIIKSFMNTINRVGDKTPPCGTP